MRSPTARTRIRPTRIRTARIRTARVGTARVGTARVGTVRACTACARTAGVRTARVRGARLSTGCARTAGARRACARTDQLGISGDARDLGLRGAAVHATRWSPLRIAGRSGVAGADRTVRELHAEHLAPRLRRGLAERFRGLHALPARMQRSSRRFRSSRGRFAGLRWPLRRRRVGAGRAGDRRDHRHVRRRWSWRRMLAQTAAGDAIREVDLSCDEAGMLDLSRRSRRSAAGLALWRCPLAPRACIAAWETLLVTGYLTDRRHVPLRVSRRSAARLLAYRRPPPPPSRSELLLPRCA